MPAAQAGKLVNRHEHIVRMRQPRRRQELWNLMKTLRLVAVSCSSALLLSGCLVLGQKAPTTPTPLPAGGLQIQLLGAGGPYSAAPPYLVAAGSEPELDSLLHAVAPFFHQPDPWDASANVTGRVYLGIAVHFCTTLDAVGARFTSPALVTLQLNTSGQCAPGAGTAARPPMYLAAISTGQLPRAVVTFRLSDGSGQARVDLRPGQGSIDPSVVATQARDAVRAAFLSVGTDGSSRAIAELDRLRFPTSPPICQVAATSSGPRSGIFVVVNEGPVFPSHTEGFLWLDGALTDCGTAP